MARDRASRPEARPLRLFVAVDVPSEAKDVVARAIDPLMGRVRVARWTRADGWHVTLKFLGATWPRLLDWVGEEVAAAASSTDPFQTALTDLGVFPSARRARVVWAGLSDPEGRFARLSTLLDERLADHFVPERRPFTPHLTLARLNPPRAIEEFAPELVGTSVASDPFPVDQVVLYRSHLSPRGADYEAVERFPLGR
jgi:RNA 2',3'-cyclic 3'-phosphodiesterase